MNALPINLFFVISIFHASTKLHALNIATSVETLNFTNALALSCEGNFDEAEHFFVSIPQESPHYAASVHSMGNLATIKGNLILSGMYHSIAKMHDPQAKPPLALMYLENNPCYSIGDIFWTSSFTKKKVYEIFFEDSWKDHRDLLNFHTIEDLVPLLNEMELQVLFDAHIGLAIQLEDSGLVEYSMKHFQQAAMIRPQNLDLIVRNAMMVPVIYDSKSELQNIRERLEQNINEILTLLREDKYELDSLNHLSMPGTFYIVYQGYNDKSLMKEIRELYRTIYPRMERVYLSPVEGYELLRDPARSSAGKIRIGFASHYFRKHSVCKLICGLIQNIDRQKFHVTIFSSVKTEDEDEWTHIIRERSDNYIHVKEGMFLKNRNVPFDESLDILVYPDIGMHPGSVMWASSRLAKIQVCFWGHPTTTGLDNMDYFITSDLFEKNDGQERFTEQLIRMDSLSFYYMKPMRPRAINKKSFDVSTIGIPKDGIIVLCPQTLPKFHPMFDQILHRILERDDNIFIVTIYDKNKYFWKKKLSSRINISEKTSNRLKFIPTQDEDKFNSLIQKSVVLLDPFPFGGGITSIESFSMCKAIVTLPALQTVPGLTAGMIEVMNITGKLIVQNEDEYVEAVFDLVKNEQYRKRIEREICQNHDLLYNQKQVVDEWELVFERVLKNLNI